MSLVLLLGGARSGKSALGVAIATRASGDGPVCFVATGEPRDAEMAARIASHRNGRPAHWAVVEEPRDVEKVVAACDPAATLILDCLTLWVANLVEAGLQDADVRARASSAAVAAARRPGLVVVVSNEVGSGIVPADHLSRRYRDLLGNVNSVFAAEAEEAYLVVAGRLLALSRPADVLASAARAGSAGAS